MFFEAKIDCDAFDVSEHLEGLVKRDLRGKQMARIGVKRSAIPQIGKAFGEAANDPAKREAFRNDPIAYLRSAGVAQEELDGLNIVLHEDDDNTVHVVLPQVVDAGRLRANDHEYLKMLGTMAVLGCHRPLS
ncbi:hypothetical protein L1787_18700 [Acuticoccus sp. M5D2P5]|uniref:hypothetical protein n=1 Tax=Acuticoccus kalidii TaxID=2910977 RepID=UPI001F213B15|nr:hypothetical protein [Acuticoccus kalidii]MCF3935424.1 hypothetical protein [Acuticoccus kalidii]